MALRVGGAAASFLRQFDHTTSRDVLHADSGYQVVGIKAVDASDISAVKD